MLDRILASLTAVRTDLIVGAIVMVVSFAASLILVTVVVARLPEDYFVSARLTPPPSQSALRRWSAAIARNLAGALLIVAGAIMSVPGVPGQGILTIIIGLLLVDFPGKKNLVRRIVRRPRILRSLNSIRARFGKAPLRVDARE
ncbi:MAG: hypothetical protein HY898_07410 [Deltaproteobacteria bacterium]|nr:hypothetical protein [Deltaproteobacteria bacterium]